MCIRDRGVGVPVYAEPGETDVVEIAKRAVAHAKKHGNDMVFLDTAGRLHVDEALMDELRRLKEACLLYTSRCV